MPFRSAKQRRYLWANEPEIARRWTKEHGSRIQKDNGGIMRLPFQGGGNYLQNTAAQNMFGKMYHTLNPFEKFQINQAIDTYGPNEPGITASSAGGGGGGGGGILGDEDINLDEFMNERLQERIEKQRRMIEEQLGIDSLPKSNKPLTGLDLAQDNPVFDETTGQWYNKPGGYPIPDPDIPKKMDMYNMPYTAEPFSPIAQWASLTGDNKYIKRRQEDEDDNVPLRFRDAEYLSDYFNPRQRALRQSNRYWNRGDARTIPQRFMGGLRNVGGDIMGGIRNIGQGVSNFAGNLRQGHTTQAGYNAARQARINQNRVLMRSNPKSLENLRINYARMGLNQDQINQKVQNFQNVTNQISNQSAGNQQTGNQDRSGWKSPGAPGAPAHRTRELMYTGGLASIWPR